MLACDVSGCGRHTTRRGWCNRSLANGLNPSSHQTLAYLVQRVLEEVLLQHYPWAMSSEKTNYFSEVTKEGSSI